MFRTLCVMSANRCLLEGRPSGESAHGRLLCSSKTLLKGVLFVRGRSGSDSGKSWALELEGRMEWASADEKEEDEGVAEE